MATIGIEMCVNSDGDFDMQVYNTAVLMAGLCFVHGWNPLTDIRTHQDCDGKHCPNELLNGRNGWSVQEVYELTNDLLGEIKEKNGQGVPLETEKYVNASHVPPSYQTWLSWQTEKNKNRADYNSWVQDQMNNRINQEDVWFKLSDLVIKHFGPDLLAGEAELHHIQNRTAPYKNPSAIVSNRSEPLNLEEQYLGHTPLGQLSFATSDSIFKTRMNNEYGETNTRLINGRNEILVDEPLNIPKSEQDSFHRILSYLQALIRVESGGALTKLGQPILKDLNNKGVPTKGGFIGAKLTDGIDKNTAERLLWDWEYNLEHVVTLLADTYHLAKQNNNKEIRINALEWAIASQSWVELPDILFANNSEYDTARGYANGKIDPLRNNLFKEVELNRNMHIAENFKQDTVPILYTGLDNRQINNVFFIYEGLSPTQSMLMTPSVVPVTMSASSTGNTQTLSNSLQPLSASSGFNPSSGKFLPRNPNNPFEQYRKIAKEKAEKEAADLINSGELSEDEVDDFVEDAIKDALEDAPNIGTITNEEADDLLGERGGGGREGGTLEGSEMSQHYTPWNNLQSIEGMYVDMLSYDQTGRLLRAFPTFIVQLIDEGKWFSNFRTWDNFYGYNALQSIDVHKSRKIVADTAIVTMSNMYGGLTAQREDMGYDALNKPSFFSNTFWSQYVFGNPSEETFDQRKNLAQSMSLRPGARLHIRMGYGADPFGLPIVFNGTIAEMSTGEIVTILAQGDGIELTNAIVGDEQDTTDWLGNVKAPRDFIGKVMTSKGNWLKDILNNVTEAFIFKIAPSGIAHFGSDINTETGNILPWSDDYGESLMNVYTNDGTGAKSTYHNENGHYIGVINHYMEYLNPTSISSFLFEPGGAFDEDSVLLSIYGHSLWDIIQTYALTSHDYHAAVVPFEYRSTLFFGKNHWPMIYAFDSVYGYDASTGAWGRSVKKGGWLMKTFMQAHIVNSRYNLISNEIKASADGVYNNVVVEYEGHNTPLIQADSDIRYDQQKTAYIQGTMLTRHDKQLGESIRNFFTTEVQASTYGHSTVRDFMKDMYKGSYIMLGEASIKPHDLMYMSDTIQDLQGIHLVKGVHHSMSIDSGFISTIEPDAYVVNFDTEGLAIGELAWTLGKEITGRTLLASFRPSILESETGTFSENITSAVMNKLMDVAANRHSYPFAKNYNRGYLAALTRKSKGMLFKQIGHQLSDPVILDYANRIFDTENRLLGSDTRGLLQYMNNYNESKYPASIKRYIQEQKETQEATKKFRFNQKQYFNGVNIDESMAAIVANGKKAAQDLNSFWEAYEREEALVAPNNPDTSVPQPGQDPGLVEQSDTLSTQINGVVGKLLDVRKNIPENMLWTPFKILGSSIDNLWTNKKQNSECVKIIPMTYKGTEFVAAMEGHRGGVWGDTPSDWDKWFNLEFGDSGDHPVTGLLSRWLNALGDFY